jgi:hypothetical protein
VETESALVSPAKTMQGAHMRTVRFCKLMKYAFGILSHVCSIFFPHTLSNICNFLFLIVLDVEHQESCVAVLDRLVMIDRVERHGDISQSMGTGVGKPIRCPVLLFLVRFLRMQHVSKIDNKPF